MKKLFATIIMLISSLAQAEGMSGKIGNLKIAPSAEALEITFDTPNELRCPTVVLYKTSTPKMFDERLSFALAAMMADKTLYAYVDAGTCTVNMSNTGFIIYK